jgi:hypothetical protein
MPSPFPGMDPFVEGQIWKGFHSSFIAVLGEMLVAQLRPRYIVQIEDYVYLAREDEEPDRLLEPDLAVVEASASMASTSGSAAGAVATLSPTMHTLHMPRRHRQKFLSIRDRQFRNVVTVIELLSPTNKTPGDGYSEYLAKRYNVSYTTAHLVEIDLLRDGQRLATREPLEPGDFYAYVSRTAQASTVEVYHWSLRDRLPVIPIPLAEGDRDVPLDLQAAFTTTYDRWGYNYALNYQRAVEPPLEPTVADWVRSVVAERLKQ